MAETFGAATAVLALAQFAFQSSITLYQLLKSFQSHNSRVRDLETELSALSEVLSALAGTIEASKVDMAALKIPLQQCGNVCADFQKEIVKCCTHSNSTRTSFRDWAKLRYMGDDMDGFRRLISSYKLTISIALSDATLQSTSATSEGIESYHELIQTTQEDLRDRLQSMDNKLEHLLGRNTKLSESDEMEVELIKGERLSTEKCLQVCAELSSHIAQLQRNARLGASENDTSPTPTHQKIYSDGLQECVDSLSRTARKLAGYENELFDRLLDKTRTAVASEEDHATLSMLREQRNEIQKSMEVCAKANENLREEVATIENHATGDAIQLMVSINDKPIHGKNRGMGWRTRQLGGYVDKDSLQDAIKSFSNLILPVPPHGEELKSEGVSSEESHSKESHPGSGFVEQYGEGFSLASRPASGKENSKGYAEGVRRK